MREPEQHEQVITRCAEPLGSEAWIEAFETQATDELFAKARRYARLRARGVARAGGVADDYYVRELVQDALDDTFAGVLQWDPTRASLEAHVINAIRGRSRHDREHAIRYRRATIDAAQDVATAPATSDTGSNATEAVAEVRRLAVANSDHDVVRLLDAFADGAIAKHEVLQATGMSAKTYRNARIRLHRIVKQLTLEVYS